MTTKPTPQIVTEQDIDKLKDLAETTRVRSECLINIVAILAGEEDEEGRALAMSDLFACLGWVK